MIHPIVWRREREKDISKMKKLLKFITCGSVDDGKSTLIGKLLYDAKLLYKDQQEILEKDEVIDYSLLVDGLLEEIEQGITIDVAYRYFSTRERSFIVVDTPGHEEYTRNMAVGASYADVSVILVDATKGVSIQTFRHAYICALMGIKHFIIAVNKMDLLNYNEEKFKDIENSVLEFFDKFETESIQCIPISAINGENLNNNSYKMKWYTKMPLLSQLESIDVYKNNVGSGFVMPIQRVSRTNNFRGYQGQIDEGKISTGDRVQILPSNEIATIKDIYVSGNKCDNAIKGQSVTVSLEEKVDIARGDMIVNKSNIIKNNEIEVSLLWMSNTPLLEGDSYIIKCNNKTMSGTIREILYKSDVISNEKIKVKKITKNDLASCKISLSVDLLFVPFNENKHLGSIILIDRIDNSTSGCGIILNDSTPQKLDCNNINRKLLRSKQKHQTPFTIWFTGLSGSGKTTLSKSVEQILINQGYHCMILDGDDLRSTINSDLTFSKIDRRENSRRVAEIAKLMNDAGLIVIVSLISPYEKDRSMAREIIGEESFIEVYLDTPLDICIKRDVKGLYKKAINNTLDNFTGISDIYEKPKNPYIEINTFEYTIKESTELIFNLIRKDGIFCR